MGFFGGLMIALGLTSFAVEGIRTSSEDSYAKSSAISHGRDWYIDHKGITRYVKDDKPVIHTRIKVGGIEHEVLKYVGSDIIIRDYTQDRFNMISKESMEIAKEIGGSVYLIEDRHHNDTILEGDRVKDIKTGDIYVIRLLSPIEYYIDVKTLKAVRPTDRQILKWKVNKARNDIKYKIDFDIQYICDYMDYFNEHRDIILKRKDVHAGYYPLKGDVLYEIDIKNLKKYNINKIYKEGQTWEDIKEELSDMGIPQGPNRIRIKQQIIAEHDRKNRERRDREITEHLKEKGLL